MHTKGPLAGMPLVVGVLALGVLVPDLLRPATDPRTRRLTVGIAAITLGALLSAVVRLSGIDSIAFHLSVDAIMFALTVFALIQMKRAFASPKEDASRSWNC
jgi:hypothetical protein